MQIVWSRAAQVRCIRNCPSCVSTTNAIARSATTITARRTVRVGDIFTVSLSSLAAGLAFADSRQKDQRRKQWDKAIAEARAAVEATDIQQQSRLAALSDKARVNASDMDETRVATLRTAAKRELQEMEAWGFEGSQERDQWMPIAFNQTDTWLDVFDWAREQRKVREKFGLQDWKGPPLILLRSLSSAQLNRFRSDGRLLGRFYGGPDCSNWMDEQSRSPSHPSMKQIRTQEWSVAKLVLKLLLYGSERSLQPVCPSYSMLCEVLKGEEIETRLEYANRRLNALHAPRSPHYSYEDFECPQSPDYDYMSVGGYGQSTELNTSLKNLLEAMKQETDISNIMSWLCYDLLTARLPPNVCTYNMLLVHFSELDKGYLVKAVLTSMRESHIQPNETTNATVLRFFTKIENQVAFSHFWHRMEGHRKPRDSIHPIQGIHPALKGRYHIVEKNQDRVVEKARMNGQVYEALIVGAMRFFGAQTAMHYYRNMISEGWSPGPGIFLALLQDCCSRLDWKLGIAVLEQLESTAEKISTLTYEWMLRLCQCCGQREFFDQIMLKGVLCGALPASMLDLPDHAKVEDVAFLIECAKDLDKLERTAARMRQTLGDRLLENIFHGCEEKVSLGRRINQANSRWKIRLVLQKRLNVLSTEINCTILEGYHALFNPENISSVSVKFWLSERAKLLEQKLEKQVHGSATYLGIKGRLWWRRWWERLQAAKYRRRTKGPRVCKRLESPSDRPGSDSLPSVYSPPEDGPIDLGQWNLPGPLPMANPANGSFWENHEEQMAAATDSAHCS